MNKEVMAKLQRRHASRQEKCAQAESETEVGRWHQECTRFTSKPKGSGKSLFLHHVRLDTQRIGEVEKGRKSEGWRMAYSRGQTWYSKFAARNTIDEKGEGRSNCQTSILGLKINIENSTCCSLAGFNPSKASLIAWSAASTVAWLSYLTRTSPSNSVI